ncbi:MAG: phosphodiester glycosidase family protein [Clostridiales bacterium]|nr:phosphodiester glycosidase family protein [Clostridiales bacterium]MDY5514383.1 phosphodiester glycosidase family protein [Candidatus Ventricola sp.]
MKKLLSVAALVLAALLPLCAAQAATLPNSKTIEDTLTYEDETIRVTIDRWCYAFNRTELRFFVANVYASRPDQLQTAFAGEAYSKDNAEATSAIAQRHDAVLAINGDYYNYKDKYNLVIRNGELYRDLESTRDQLLVYADGSFEALPASAFAPGNGQAYLDSGVMQSFTFGPILVDGGEIVPLPEKYIIYTGDTIREPRTAIGWVDETHYVVVVADGRRDGWSDKGMTLQELQQVFVEQGCQVAYNLDGGGSATMVLNGELVNKTSGSRERNVSDIVYFTR